MLLKLSALIWGLAEAILFFFVPDILLTLQTIRKGRRSAFRLSLWVCIGAVTGGLFVRFWAGLRPAMAERWIESLPAISKNMMENAMLAMHQPDWAWSMLVGSFSAVPYKVFALYSDRLSDTEFILISIPTRLTRFIVVILTISLLDRLVRYRFPRLTLRARLLILLSGWAVFYTLFFVLMPN